MANRRKAVHATRLRLVAMAVVGIAVAVVVGATIGWVYSPTAGWAAACIVYIAWSWIVVGPMDAAQAKEYAMREDPGRAGLEVLIQIAAVAGIGAVALLLVSSKDAVGVAKAVVPVFALVSLALSWFLVHTLFTLRYASLYYANDGGIDFNQDDDPVYVDFAYVAFTLGMTYQVSDTNLKTHVIRSTALRHALLSYLFGAVILAASINLVAGLAK
jgi:uncharacterized membrane protein